jgi:hypothetical protein
MAPAPDHLPPHRRLVWWLEMARECLEEARELDGYLPHWGQTEVGRMAEDVGDLLDRVAREIPGLAPLQEEEWENVG